jgi:hypothetical protein
VSRGGLLLWVLGALLVSAGALWAVAFMRAAEPEPATLLVYGEPVAKAGAELPLRVVAVWPEEPRRARFSGAVFVGEERVEVDEHGHARVRLPAAPGEHRLHLRGDVEGVPAAGIVVVEGAASWPRRLPPRFSPWRVELAAGTEVDRAGSPLYPVAGRVSSWLPSELVILEESGPLVRTLPPHAAAMSAPDGRALKMDRTGLEVALPAAVYPGAEVAVQVRVARAERLWLEVLLAGVVRAMVAVDAPAGSSRLLVRVPDDAAPGSLFGVHGAPSPLGSSRGHAALAVVVAPGAALQGPALWRWVSAEGLPFAPDDPLLALLRQAPAPSSVERALLARLVLEAVRPKNLAPPGVVQRAAHLEARAAATARARWPFRAAGLLFALVAALAFAMGAAQAEGWRGGLEEGARPRRQAGPLLWAGLAFGACLTLLWVLDWALSFTLRGPMG